MSAEPWLTRLCSGLHIPILREISLALNICSPKIDFASSFIENGGDSLSSLNLQAALRNMGMYVPFEAILTAKSVFELIQHAVSNRRRLSIDWAMREYDDNTNTLKRRLSKSAQRVDEQRRKRLRKRSVTSLTMDGGRFPMTELQLAFVHSSMDHQNKNVIQYQETHRYENLPVLRRAWKTVLESEPIFRMHFEVDESGGHFKESHKTCFVWEEAVVENKEAFRKEEREFESDPDDVLIVNRFRVITLGEKSTIIWRVHHSLIDGHSQTLLRSKLQRVLLGESISEGPSFGDFALQLQSLQQRYREIAKAYWLEQREEYSAAATELLTPTPPALADEAHRELLQFVAFKVDVHELSLFCKHIGITLASFYSAAWALTLTRYMDADVVSFGAALCGRTLPIPGVENMVGPAINTLPFYVRLDRDTAVPDWLRHVMEQVARLTSFQWSTAEHGFSRNFTSALNVQLGHEKSAASPFDPVEPPSASVLSDVPLHVDVGSCGNIRLAYHPTRYSRSQITCIAETFSAALIALQQPHDTMSQCVAKLLPEAQWRDLSRIGNWTAPTTQVNSIQEDLLSLFSRAVQNNADGIAVSQGTKTMTYAELDKKSSIVASQLTSIVGPEDVVCVHADRSIEWTIAIYGVLKAGAVYCPFAEDMPSAVRNINFETANAKVFLAGTERASSFQPASCSRFLTVQGILRQASESIIATAAIRTCEPRPDAPAYLCFTSGSTGKPKGVLCRHRGLVAFQSDAEVRLFSKPGWRIAQVMSPGFDGSIHEIFSTLSYGSQLVLKDPANPLHHIKSADAVILTPSVAKALNPDDYPRLSIVYLVGEAVPQSVNNAWAAKKTLYNMYGPTEATCGASIKRLHADQPVTLGPPNPTTRIYILDRNQDLVPPGSIGEIYLAGVQVAVGYVGRPDETARRFLPDTVLPELNEQMYRTGDRGYWSKDGELMFLGRGDRQIKLRGFRMDLDDLEIRMQSADERVKAVAVTLKEDYLIAQVQPAHLDVAVFKKRIQQHIPAYAMPRHIRAVESFPLTPVGKLDYKKIASQNYSDIPGHETRSIWNPYEKMVATAVRDLLDISKDSIIDLGSTFADLGGHSILHIQLSQRLTKCLGRRVTLRSILKAPSLRALATTLAALAIESTAGAKHSISDEYAVAPIEKDWWTKCQKGSSSSFNVTFACELGPAVQLPKLKEAWNAVLERHSILRSSYEPCPTRGLRRKYHVNPPCVKTVEDIDVNNEINVAFDLENDYLIRVLISPTAMLVIISHIICDFTTLRTLLDDVAVAYRGESLPPLRKSYFQVDWSIPESSTQFPFWTEYFAGVTSEDLAIGRNVRRTTWAGTSHMCNIPEDVHKRMRAFCERRKVTMHQVALAAVAQALTHHSESCDITLGAPYLNRASEDDQSVVGLFLEPLPIRIQHDSHSNDSFIEVVHDSSRAALSHAVPWHQLLSHLAITTDFPNHPIFDVMVSFHDVVGSIDFGVPDAKSIHTWTEGAKFKLMAEFQAGRNGDLSLRLEYSTECFSNKDMKLLEAWIVLALDGLTKDESFDDVRRTLRMQTE